MKNQSINSKPIVIKIPKTNINVSNNKIIFGSSFSQMMLASQKAMLQSYKDGKHQRINYVLTDIREHVILSMIGFIFPSLMSLIITFVLPQCFHACQNYYQFSGSIFIGLVLVAFLWFMIDLVCRTNKKVLGRDISRLEEIINAP
jgi:hypothetical protein